MIEFLSLNTSYEDHHFLVIFPIHSLRTPTSLSNPYRTSFYVLAQNTIRIGYSRYIYSILLAIDPIRHDIQIDSATSCRSRL